MGRSPFERLSPDARDTVPERVVRTKVKAFEEHRFRPMYAAANTRISCYAASDRRSATPPASTGNPGHGAPVQNLSGGETGSNWGLHSPPALTGHPTAVHHQHFA